MPDEPEDLVLGNYRVLRREDGSHWLLGRGGYGTTYKAEHKHLKQAYALKVINDHLVRDDRAKQRFLHEARVAASLDHANIARIYDFGECDGIFYYAMSYCSGGDLEQFSAKHGPQPWSVVKGLALQILAALETAHRQGLLHRDLKPSNIMLASDDGSVNLRLIDFGLVKALDDYEGSDTAITQTREGSFMGNPLTASPEQFREETLDERSDLFSLGITLWCLLHGGSPFGKASAAEIAHQRLSSEGHRHQLPAGLEPEARYILERLLSTDKEQRFRNAAEVREAILSGETGEATAAAAPAGSGADQDWEDLWDLGAQQKRFPYGTYYSCTGRRPGMGHATFFVPEQHSPALGAIEAEARKVMHSAVQALNRFSQEGVHGGVVCFLSSPFPSGNFQVLLQAVGHLRLQGDLPFFQQIASAVDEVVAQDLPGVELDDHDIMLGVSVDYQYALLSREDWELYFRQDGAAHGGHTAGLRAVVLPKLARGSGPAEATVTISGDDMAANPVARFAGFLYRALSGMSVKQGAYLNTAVYVSTSNISEKANRYLSEVMAGEKTPATSFELLVQLCQLEGVSWSTTQLEDALSMTVSSYPSQADVPPAPPQPASAPPTAPPPPLAGTTSATTLSAGAPPGPPPAPAAAPARKAKRPAGKGKKPLVLGAVAALVLAALAVAGLLVIKGRGSSDDPGTAERGKGRLALPKLAVLGSPPANAFSLVDREGVPLGEFAVQSNQGVVTDFPLDVFDDSNRWPLEIRLRDATEGFVMDARPLALARFGDEQDGTRTYQDAVELEVRAHLEIQPVVTIAGRRLDSGPASLASRLRPESRGEGWIVRAEGNTFMISLPPGEGFPIEAELDLEVPCISRTPVTIDAADRSPAWDLELRTREVKFAGLTEFASMAFTPDFSLLSDSATTAFLQSALGGYQMSAAEFRGMGMKWELPVIQGTLAVVHASGNATIPLAPDAKFKVLLQGADRDPAENPEIERQRVLAESGVVAAQQVLGTKYHQEIGTPAANRRGALWLQLAAEQGDVAAHVDLGNAYVNWQGVGPNIAKAVELFRKAAELGDPSGKADNNVGVCYLNGAGGLPQDPAEAQRYFEIAARKGDPDGMTNLGSLLTEKQNPRAAEGVEWLEKAMAQDQPRAAYLLGICYQTGVGVPKDFEKAKELIEQAGRAGYTP